MSAWLKFILVRAVCIFKYSDVRIVVNKRVKHPVEGGFVGPFVGVIAEDEARSAAVICYHESNREASIN